MAGLVLVKVGIVAVIVALPSSLAVSLGAAHAGVLVAVVAGFVAVLVVRRWCGRTVAPSRPDAGGESFVAEAVVPTARPGRYLGQLCRHANAMGHAALRKHAGKAAEELPEVLHVEHSETEGVLDLSLGRCTVRAGEGTLTLRAEAPDEESLGRLEAILTKDLERFGQREQLRVTWRRTLVS